MITQQRLKELVSYDEDTGVFKALVGRGALSVGDTVGAHKGDGYLQMTIDGRKYRAHRLAMLYVEGEMPAAVVDHINRNKADNRYINLRHATVAQNSRNRKVNSNNTSGVPGVSYNKRGDNWIVSISVDGLRRRLGRYKDFELACFVRSEAEAVYNY